MSEKLTRPPRVDDEEERQDFMEQVERQLNLVGRRTLDVGSILAGTVSTFTITVPGCRAAFDQAVALAPPPGIESNLLWSGVVSSDNTVTVRLYNPTGSPIDPASGTWGARVFL